MSLFTDPLAQELMIGTLFATGLILLGFGVGWVAHATRQTPNSSDRS